MDLTFQTDYCPIKSDRFCLMTFMDIICTYLEYVPVMAFLDYLFHVRGHFEETTAFLFLWKRISATQWVPNVSIQLDRLSANKRNASLSGKTWGGGLLIYVNTEWYTAVVLVSSYCSMLREFVNVRCRSFLFTAGIPHPAHWGDVDSSQC